MISPAVHSSVFASSLRKKIITSHREMIKEFANDGSV